MDDCDGAHCPCCGGHKIGFYEPGMCDTCMSGLCSPKESYMENSQEGSALGQKVWLMYVHSDDGTVSAVPFSSLGHLEQHARELRARKTIHLVWDNRPEIVL